MKNTSSMLLNAVAAFAVISVLALLAEAQNQPKLSDPEIASVAVTANQNDIGFAGIAKRKSKNADVQKFADNIGNFT